MRLLSILILLVCSGVCVAEKRKTKSSPPPPIMVAAATEKYTLETEANVPKTFHRTLDVAILFGGSSSSLSNFNDVGKVSGRTAWDLNGGILLDLPVYSNFSLETGLYYAPRKIGFIGQHNSIGGYVKMHHLEFPLMARYWIADVISVGAGGYGSYGIDDVSVLGENDAGGGLDGDENVVTSKPYQTARVHQFDYGFIFGVQAKLPIASRLKVILDYRYNLGMRNILYDGTRPGADYRMRAFRFLGGIALSL